MSAAEEFAQGKIACEVNACSKEATTVSVYGAGPFPIDIVPIGPKHFWCDLHKRDHYSYRKVNGQYVRF